MSDTQISKTLQGSLNYKMLPGLRLISPMENQATSLGKWQKRGPEGKAASYRCFRGKGKYHPLAVVLNDSSILLRPQRLLLFL